MSNCPPQPWTAEEHDLAFRYFVELSWTTRRIASQGIINRTYNSIAKYCWVRNWHRGAGDYVPYKAPELSSRPGKKWDEVFAYIKHTPLRSFDIEQMFHVNSRAIYGCAKVRGLKLKRTGNLHVKGFRGRQSYLWSIEDEG